MNDDGPDMVIPLFVHVESVGADVSFVNGSTTLASLGLQALSGVPSEPMAFLKEMAADDGVLPNCAQASTVALSSKTLPSKKQTSIEEWAPWHKAFGALNDEF